MASLDESGMFFMINSISIYVVFKLLDGLNFARNGSMIIIICHTCMYMYMYFA